MTIYNREDSKTALPQLEKRVAELEKIIQELTKRIEELENA